MTNLYHLDTPYHQLQAARHSFMMISSLISHKSALVFID